MSENQETSGASRRDVLKSGAWGVGALAGVVGATGLTSSDASAAQLAAAALPTGTNSYFLKLDGILGESTDAKHKGEIQLLSFSWGSSNPGTTGSAPKTGSRYRYRPDALGLSLPLLQPIRPGWWIQAFFK